MRSDTGNRVLVLAAEDYSGESDSPVYPSSTGPSSPSYYGDALSANGLGYDVYDVDAEGRKAPDPLGVLSHYDAVIWYTGNDLLTREPGQGARDRASRALANDMVVNVRDFLNEGGKLLYTGQYAATAQLNAFVFNVEGEPPFCPPGGPAREAACIPISNDFLQYYLGTYPVRRRRRGAVRRRRPGRGLGARLRLRGRRLRLDRVLAQRRRAAPTTKSTSTRC